MSKFYFNLSLYLVAAIFSQNSYAITVSFTQSASGFPVIRNQHPASLIYDTLDAKVVGISLHALAGDIQLICSQIPTVGSKLNHQENQIIAGTVGHSKFIDQLIAEKRLDVSAIKTQREAFIITTLQTEKNSQLIIAGNDRRGTAYGIFHVAHLLGVSPWVWWADALPEHHTDAFISGVYISQSPSVEYRGIFINDEDWGLQPWAAKHLDSDIKDIGPKTYAKVFELLLRLKANFIWPAMHPCTKAFYYYKENPQIADDYAIVVGGSHCEPLLRNNVFEWSTNFEKEYGHKPGEWRYDTNREEIHRYWDDRIKQAVNFESVFTVGMRGIHDGSMPGPKDKDAKRTLLETVIDDQRSILSNNLHKPAKEIPQIFIPYKEVLSIYQNGLSLPDDITIIWPDDNHGYIRQLPNPKEQTRSGDHGVYYHLSYWGTPADYLWLSSISPALISHELHRAYAAGARKLWVFNVGDIKPAEAEMQYCLDLAWDITQDKPEKTQKYIFNWSAETFGAKQAKAIAAIKEEYYALANGGKPEHLNMINYTEKDASARLKRYANLLKKTNQLRQHLDPRQKDCYDELIGYPVAAATYMNKKVLFAKVSRLNQTEASAHHDTEQKALQAFDSIQKITDHYNKTIANGKWEGMMSWHPRERVVFEMPATQPDRNISKQEQWLPEPLLTIDTKKLLNKHSLIIPGLGKNNNGLILTDSVGISYTLRLKPGSYIIKTKWIPDFDTRGKGQLRYKIKTGKSGVQLVNIHSNAETAQWEKNVVYGYSYGETTHTIDTNNTLLTIQPADTAIVLNGIEIYPATHE